MAKTKQELIDSIRAAIEGADIQFNPEHVATIEHIGTCFGAQFENRIRSLKNRLGTDGIDKIIESCREQSARYREIQDRHRAEIRGLKDRLAANPAMNRLCLYAGDVHVITESPVTFGMTVLTPDGTTCLTGITSENLFPMLEELLDGLDHTPYMQRNEIRCPACGSPWQTFKDAPIVHCARCNSNWVLFTRRQISCDCVLDPVSMDLDRGKEISDRYLSDTGYTVSNKDTLAKIKRAISCIPGDKVVNVVASSGKYAGWHISFKCRDGQIEHEPHFDECADTALRACNMANDSYRGRKLDECMTFVIRAPKCPDTCLDDLVETAGSYDQPKCDTYAVSMAAGHVFAMDPDGLKKAYGGDGDMDDFKDLSALCPWFEGMASVEAKLMDSDGETFNVCSTGKRRKELIN